MTKRQINVLAATMSGLALGVGLSLANAGAGNPAINALAIGFGLTGVILNNILAYVQED